MIYRALFTLWVAGCAALPALAAELEFSAGGEVEYDNNVFRSEDDTENDVLFRLRPGVRVYEDRGDDLNFSVGYEAPIEFSVDNSEELDDVDHLGTGRFDYHVNDRIDVFGTERYGYLRSTLRQQGIDADEVEDNPQFNDQRDRIKTNNASLGALYRFSPRTVARGVVNSSFFDSTRDDRAKVWSVGGTADLNYALTLQHQVGAGLGYTYQDFDDRQGIPGSQTHTAQLFGTWRWMFDPTLSFDLTAGPAYLQTQQEDADQSRAATRFPFGILQGGELPAGLVFSDGAPAPSASAGSLLLSDIGSCGNVDGFTVASCNGNIVVDPFRDPVLWNSIASQQIQVVNPDSSGESDQTVTGFVEAVMTKHWLPTFHTALRYSREQGDASGVGGTVIVDAVTLSNTWDFADRWSLAVRGDFVRRESAFDIAQTFDLVTSTPVGAFPTVAVRNGVAFNSTQDVEIDTDRYSAAIRITHLLFRTTTLYGQVRYEQQESGGNSLGSTSDFENILATFGVRHVFEPITLW